MRIARVAFSFFAVGFVAGTFEQAAGLGDAQRVRRASANRVETASSVLRAPRFGVAPAAFDADGEAGRRQAWAGRRLLDMGDGGAAEAVAAAFAREAASHVAAGEARAEVGSAAPAATVIRLPLGSQAAIARPEAATPQRKLRPFFELPEEGPPVVPQPQLAERPREFILPLEKGRVTSLFNQGRRHPAIDLAGPLGTPVYATTRRQRITFAGRRGGYGNLVVTRDPLGRQHYYGHLQRITARVGALLEQGEALGLLGSTGRSTGPHVHYEVRTRAGRHLDPSKLLFPDRPVRRGYAWHTPRPAGATKYAARSGQPRPR